MAPLSPRQRLEGQAPAPGGTGTRGTGGHRCVRGCSTVRLLHLSALLSHFPSQTQFGFPGYLTNLLQHLLIPLAEDGSVPWLWLCGPQGDHCHMKCASRSGFVTGHAQGYWK